MKDLKSVSVLVSKNSFVNPWGNEIKNSFDFKGFLGEFFNEKFGGHLSLPTTHVNGECINALHSSINRGTILGDWNNGDPCGYQKKIIPRDSLIERSCSFNFNSPNGGYLYWRTTSGYLVTFSYNIGEDYKDYLLIQVINEFGKPSSQFVPSLVERIFVLKNEGYRIMM